ncbi:MAG: SusC/RagA family TonB-linked outer membrane protein, partial [Tannerellaceae bacterium]|nr:SusC/RagA family TonB-linked outer membrane protein [Tannerellaceae bacterium]
MHNSKWKLITVFVMLFTVGNIFAEATKMNLSLKNVTLKQFIEVIENKTDYTFMLDHTVNLSQRISVTSNQEDIETILNKAFLNKNLKYEIAGKQIILAVSSIAMNDNPDKTLTGVVLDETGTPVIGANIIQKGTTNGTISDMDGKFSINVPQGAILIISYIGYNPKEVVVRNFTNLTVNLQEDSRALEEVVVVGYGSVRKSDLTSSVTSVKAEDMLVSAKPDVASALQGIAPGVEVSTNSASPGGDLDIRIRGIGTLNDNTPLYVVDGIPVRSLEFVSPNDIERMEILKDATSSAIYGSRGSSGVILITTKSGKEENGRYVINFDGSLGVQALSRELDMADALEFAKIYNEAREVSNVTGRIDVNSLTGKSTDWLGEISNKSALVQNYNLNVTGGNNISSISAGLGYYNQDGVIKSSNYERYSARINAVIKPNERVTFNFSMIAGHTSRNNIQSEKDQYQGLLFNAYLIDPITEVMKPESEWVDNPFSNYARSQYTMISNPAGVMARTFNNTKQYSGIVNIGMKLDITKALSFKTNVGVDYRDSKRATFNPEFFVNPSEKNDDNKIENSNNYRLGYIWENTLNYQNTFNSKHRINILAGY